MHTFKANIELIGVNPFVFVPEEILQDLFKESKKDKGKIPIRGTINERAYQQTLIKFSGNWRLYINTKMLNNSPKRVGEIIDLTIEFDPTDRSLKPHDKLVQALNENQQAKSIFDRLRPSLQHEIIRYIANLKTEESVDRNVTKAIDFLVGKARFIGRDKP